MRHQGRWTIGTAIPVFVGPILGAFGGLSCGLLCEALYGALCLAITGKVEPAASVVLRFGLAGAIVGIILGVCIAIERNADHDATELPIAKKNESVPAAPDYVEGHQGMTTDDGRLAGAIRTLPEVFYDGSNAGRRKWHE